MQIAFFLMKAFAVYGDIHVVYLRPYSPVYCCIGIKDSCKLKIDIKVPHSRNGINSVGQNEQQLGPESLWRPNTRLYLTSCSSERLWNGNVLGIKQARALGVRSRLLHTSCWLLMHLHATLSAPSSCRARAIGLLLDGQKMALDSDPFKL
jgi:hypothetical protein